MTELGEALAAERAAMVDRDRWCSRAFELSDGLTNTAAALAAAISLLERSPKTAAPSNKMFDQMLADYCKALNEARALLS